MKIINNIEKFYNNKRYKIGDKFLFNDKVVNVVKYKNTCKNCVFKNSKYCDFLRCSYPTNISYI